MLRKARLWSSVEFLVIPISGQMPILAWPPAVFLSDYGVCPWLRSAIGTETRLTVNDLTVNDGEFEDQVI